MRAAVFQHLKHNCESIKAWKQPYVANRDTPKPYGVIVFDTQTPDAFNRRGAFQAFTVWVYDNTGSYLALDAAINEIKNLLNEAKLTTAKGERFIVEWTGDGKDFFDDELDALAKFSEFKIPIGG